MSLFFSDRRMVFQLIIFVIPCVITYLWLLPIVHLIVGHKALFYQYTMESAVVELFSVFFGCFLTLPDRRSDLFESSASLLDGSYS